MDQDTPPLGHEAHSRAWVWPETPIQHESRADTAVQSSYDSIQGDFDAAHTTPKIVTPIEKDPVYDGNAYGIPTPVTATECRDDTSLSQSIENPIQPLTSQASNTNGQVYQELIPSPVSPLSGAKKRPVPSDSSRLERHPKYQRILPAQPQTLPRKRSAAEPNAQSKGVGLGINTQVAELAAPLPHTSETRRGGELYTDFIQIQEVLRKELNNLIHEIHATNKRANAAELRAQKAENEVYRANNDHALKAIRMADEHKSDKNILERQHRSLENRCNDLERSLGEEKAAVVDLRWQLRQERQKTAVARSERAKVVQKINPFCPSRG